MAEVKLTYDDWYSGEFRLAESIADYVNEIEIKEFPFGTLDPGVQEAISKKQKELFEKDFKALLSDWQNIFLKRLERTRDQNTLINREIAQTFSLLNKKLPTTQNIRLDAWDLSVDRGLIGEAQNYYKRVILNGDTHDFTYISSPNDPHFPEEQDPYSFSEAIYQYYLWLKGNPITDAATWDNQIFDSISSQHLFEDFITEVSTEQIKFPDICYIFHKLIEKGYIRQNITHLTFQSWINEKFGTDFNKRDLPKRQAQKNEPIYSKLLKKHKN